MAQRTARRALGLVLLCWLGMLAVRLLGPSDLLDNDQERPCAYVVDVLENGSWLWQQDESGDVTSKPPLPTWIGALFSLAQGRADRLSLSLVPAFGLLATLGALLAFGWRLFSPRAALLGALFLLFSPMGLKEIVLIRTDPIFAALSFLCAFTAWQAIQSGRGWWIFWLVGALATLTKGPLAFLFVGGALLTRLLVPKGERLPGRGRDHLVGIALLLLIAGGWWIAARLDAGDALSKKILQKELVGHAVSDIKGRLPFHGFPKPSLYFFARFAPWSLFAAFGLWRIVRRPAEDERERRGERFLAGYFGLGLLVFSIAPHQRADHLMPLIPAAALIAGREASRLRLFRHRRAPLVMGALGVLLVAIYSFGIWGRRDVVQKSESLASFAGSLDRVLGDEKLEHLGTRFTLQLHRDGFHPLISEAEALTRLAGKEPVVIAAQDRALKKIASKLPEGTLTLAQWPDAKKPTLKILANHRPQQGELRDRTPPRRPLLAVLVVALTGLIALLTLRGMKR